jgi:hypothetical protein
MDLRGGIKIRSYLGELLENVFSINYLNFDLGAVEMLLGSFQWNELTPLK